MKKKLFYILIGVFILIGGYFLMNDYKKMQLVKEAQKKAETFVYRNYEGINKVSVNKENYNFNPMGGLSISGHVNGNKSLTFSLMFNVYDHKVGEVTSVVKSPNFPPKKDKCKDNFCQWIGDIN